MLNIVTMIFVLFASMSAWAGFQGFNGVTDLKNFSTIKCSTGMTCSRQGDKFVMISSPTLTGPLAVAGAEATDALLTLQADESDDNGDDWQLKAAASGNAFVISNDTTGSHVAKLTISTAGAVTLTSTLAGYLAPQVAATATTITAAQCGSTFSNSGAVQMELPEASTVIGCTLAFVTLNASNFDVNPDDADQILTQTNAAGDAMRNATVGNSIVIRAVSASQWAVVAVNGTWSDID